MKTSGGKGSGAGAAATTVLLVALLMLVAASMRADAASVAARRLAVPKNNSCTNDPNNSGQGCQLPPAGKQAAAAHTEAPSRRLISVVSKASLGPSNCTYDPNTPKGQSSCPTPQLKAP